MLGEGLVDHLLFSSSGRKFKLVLDKKLKGKSCFEKKEKTHLLRISLDSFEYGFLFLLNIHKNGYATVDHIHIDFRNPSSNEFSLVLSVNDPNLVHWKDEMLR